MLRADGPIYVMYSVPSGYNSTLCTFLSSLPWTCCVLCSFSYRLPWTCWIDTFLGIIFQVCDALLHCMLFAQSDLSSSVQDSFSAKTSAKAVAWTLRNQGNWQKVKCTSHLLRSVVLLATPEKENELENSRTAVFSKLWTIYFIYISFVF